MDFLGLSILINTVYLTTINSDLDTRHISVDIKYSSLLDCTACTYFTYTIIYRYLDLLCIIP